MEWKDDAELFALIRAELFPAVVGDVMDGLGLTHQYLPPRIRPLRDGLSVLGRALTVLEADCSGGEIAVAQQRAPFGLMFEALDALQAGEVYICTGASPCYALWGELMSIRAQQLGATGAVLDGYSRDTRGILSLGFPVCSWGGYGQDQGVRGRVIDYRCPLEFSNAARVEHGDLVFGDEDGVLAIPRAQLHDVVRLALEKVRGENKVRTAMEQGMSAKEAFETFGIM